MKTQDGVEKVILTPAIGYPPKIINHQRKERLKRIRKGNEKLNQTKE